MPEWVFRGADTESALVRQARMIVGVDGDFSSVQKHSSIHNLVVADLVRLPFREKSFTMATANMVVEHVKDPAAALSEMHRVLQPGGQFIFHTPNRRCYRNFMIMLIPKRLKLWLISFFEERKEEDVFPTVYALNTPEEIERVAKGAGFCIEKLKMVNTSAETVMLGPVVILELLLIWVLEHHRFTRLRTNIIAVLRAA
jgi:ubiquinone/menaquinone biosynthesis C-methylase UbiE